jgi:hypothetical protein
MYILAVISETVHNRAYVAMIEDVWVLPFLIALRALPDDPNPWLFYVCPKSPVADRIVSG